MVDDAELLQAWAAGDADAGRVLFGRYYPVMLRFFTNKVGSEIPELVQQTFARCVESHARFEGRSSFRVFLLGIARNVFLKHVQARYKRQRIDFGVTSLQDCAPSPTTEYARRRQERQLLLALQRIPIEQQILLELYFWEKMPARELGELYGIPEGTVRSRLAAARVQLAAEFERGEVAVGPDAAESSDFESWAAGVRHQIGERFEGH